MRKPPSNSILIGVYYIHVHILYVAISVVLCILYQFDVRSYSVLVYIIQSYDYGVEKDSPRSPRN
jgi:hypothetical protein